MKAMKMILMVGFLGMAQTTMAAQLRCFVSANSLVTELDLTERNSVDQFTSVPMNAKGVFAKVGKIEFKNGDVAVFHIGSLYDSSRDTKTESLEDQTARNKESGRIVGVSYTVDLYRKILFSQEFIARVNGGGPITKDSPSQVLSVGLYASSIELECRNN